MENDERFSHIAKDPRFKKIPNRKRKVKIDARFSQMFTDEDFNTQYFVDKRGRKVKESAREDLSTFYKLSDDEDEDGKESAGKPESAEKPEGVGKPESAGKPESPKKPHGTIESETTVSEDGTNTRKRKQESRKMKKREKIEHGQAIEDEDKLDIKCESPALSSDEEKEDNVMRESWRETATDAPLTEEATKRLALCNMDWDKISSDDLFVLLHSFLPSGGTITSAKIYPSEYGLERMEREDEIGPTELVTTENCSDGEDQNAEFNQERLRQYQLNRLKYYYAVIEFDSAATAEKVYEECDGLEYEASSSHLDLRFIPDDMAFEHEATSQTTALPSAETYTPSEFITTALQQSTVRLTWDETDPKRVQTTMRNFSKEDLLDMDFKAYLASSSSEEESDREDVEDQDENSNKKESQDERIEKYKELLEEIQKKDNESENEMEVTWDVGLKETTEELVKRRKIEKEEKEMTPWESYLNERKQKKRMKQKMKEKHNEGELNVEMSDDEVPVGVDLSDPFFAEEIENTNIKGKAKNGEKKRKKKGTQEESEEDMRKKAELQLLLMDEEEDGKKHFNLKSIMKNEKIEKRKKKKKLKEAEKDEFEIDVSDARFSALYLSHHYAVDPSDPQFKKTKAMDSIIREKQRRSETSKTEEQNNENDRTSVTIQPLDKKKKSDPGLSSLIKNIKSNAMRYQDRKSKK